MKPPAFAYHRAETRDQVDQLLAELGDEASEPVVEDGVVRFGPLVRHADAEGAREAPLVAKAMAYVGHPAIRSRGTVVGSVAHADPAAELPAVLLALDGEVTARSANGTRTIPAAEFFVGALENALEPTEWVEEVRVPAAQAGEGFAVQEFARRHGDYAICGVMAA